MIAYKQEPFIEQAIASVLEQRADFPIELVIGEDHSPDATADRIRRFHGTDRVAIRTRFNAANLGMQPNFELTLGECRGDYIALLEGDDYWTDAAKLQRQVVFLESHSDFAICFHSVGVLLADGRLVPDSHRAIPEATDIRDLARGNYMHTCSVVFRARLFESLPASFRTATAGDFFLHMLNARHGRIGKLPQNMAVYRVHEGGQWSSRTDVDLKTLDYLEAMIGCFDPSIDEILMQRHRELAFRSCMQRIREPGAAQRLDRCLRYGSAHFFEQLVPMLQQARAFDEHKVLGLLKRFL